MQLLREVHEETAQRMPISCRNNTWYGQSPRSACLMGLTHSVPSCVSSSCDSAGLDCESLRNSNLSPHKTEMLLTGLEKSSELSRFALTNQPRLCICSLFRVYRLLLLFIATESFSVTFSHTSAFSPLLGQKPTGFLLRSGAC